MEIRGLLRRLQQLETTIAHLNRSATEVAEQRDSVVELTHQQLLVNQELMQQVRYQMAVYSVLGNGIRHQFFYGAIVSFCYLTAYGGPKHGKWIIYGGAMGAREYS